MYFNNFPLISYANSSAVNLFSRVNMSRMALQDSQAFYIYTLNGEQTAETLAYDYYDDETMHWLICLTNQVIDPYYELPLTDEQFNQFLITKYGSTFIAQNLVKFYRTNGLNDATTLTPSAFFALPIVEQKYYTGIIDNNNAIRYYVRKQEEWILNTNSQQTLQVTYTNTNTFANSEPLTFSNGNIACSFNTIQANSQYIMVNNINVVDGSGNPNLNDYTGTTLSGLFSNTSFTINTAYTPVYNITADELKFWSPVTVYEYELELNANNRNIQLLSNKYATQASKQLKTLLST